MPDNAIPARNSVPRWPFWTADASLLATALWVAWQPHFGPVHAAAVVVAVVAGGVIGVLPYVLEYKAALQSEHQEALLEALGKLDTVHAASAQIQSATAQWQSIQDSSQRTVEASRAIAEKIASEANAFAKCLQNATDQERDQLRLEVEKLKRAEGDWLQVCVRTLDHIYALFAAARRSNQPELANQISNFQAACRDNARRVGLVPFEAGPGEPFDARGHQVADPNQQVVEGAQIAETLGPGYTFQGQLLRRAIVSVLPGSPSSASVPSQENAPPA